jgi:hypothetical protein
LIACRGATLPKKPLTSYVTERFAKIGEIRHIPFILKFSRGGAKAAAA